MRKLLTILLFIPMLAKSQTEGIFYTQAVSSAGDMYVRAAVGFGAAPANRKIVTYHWPGIGATSTTLLKGEYPMKQWEDGWNGKLAAAPGDTFFFMDISVLTTNTGCIIAQRHLDYIWTNWLLGDSTTIMDEGHSFFTGYSGGGGEMSKPLTGFCFDGADWYSRVVRRMRGVGTAATGSWQNVTKLDTMGELSSQGKMKSWGFHDPADGTTTVNDTRANYEDFNDNPRSTQYSVKKSEPTLGNAHGDIDDYMFAIGTTAGNSFRHWQADTAWGLNLDCRYLLNKYYDYRKTRNYSGGGYADSLMYVGTANPEFGGVYPTLPALPGVPGGLLYYQQHAEVPGSWEIAYDMRGIWKLNKIYYKVLASAKTDSFFLYTGSDSAGWTRLLKQVVTGTDNGWYSVEFPNLDTIKRHLKVVVHGVWEDPYPGQVGKVNLQNILFYGCPAGTIDTSAITFYTGTKRKPTYGGFIGINNKLGYDPWWLYDSIVNHMRTQRAVDWFDDETGGYNDPDDVVFGPDHFGEYEADPKRHERYMNDSAKKLGISMYTTNYGASYWYGNATGVAEGWNLDTLGLNPYQITSHDRIRWMFYHITALYGTYPTDTLTLRTQGIAPIFSGDSSELNLGAENEATGGWKDCDTCTGGTKKYLSPRHLAVAGQAKFNGIRDADPTGRTRLIMDTWPELDTASTKTLVAFSQFYRTDGVNIYGAFTFNNYNIVGVKAQHPVEYNLYYKMKAVVDFAYNINPNLEVWASENGYDRNSGSIFAAPLPAGKDSGEHQADLHDFLAMDNLAAKIDRFYPYDASAGRAPGDNDASGAEASSANFATTSFWYQGIAFYSLPLVRFPAWFVAVQRKKLLENYYVDSVRSYVWEGVTVYKLRNSVHTDSVIYAVARPSYTSTTAAHDLYVGDVIGNGTKYVFSYTTSNWTATTATVTSSNISLTAGPRLEYYAVKESSTPPVQQTIFRNRVIRSQ